MRTLVHGVGINDGDWGGQGCTDDQRYRTWGHMLERCYSPRYLAQHPTYQGCSVDPEWLRFSSFKTWMDSQRWDGMVLDKDLLVIGNKIYSPETCLFVPPWINSLLANLSTKNRTLPMGVHMHGKSFRARYKSFGKTTSIGIFDSADDAHIAYRIRRLGEIKTRVDLYCDSRDADPVICAALLRLHQHEANQVAKYPPVKARPRRRP